MLFVTQKYMYKSLSNVITLPYIVVTKLPFFCTKIVLNCHHQNIVIAKK